MTVFVKIFIGENDKERKRRKDIRELTKQLPIHLDLKDLPLNRNRSKYLNKFIDLS